VTPIAAAAMHLRWQLHGSGGRCKHKIYQRIVFHGEETFVTPLVASGIVSSAADIRSGFVDVLV